MNIYDEQFIYQSACLTSAVLCIVFGAMLFFMRSYRRFISRAPIRPVRYIMARRILGVAYCIIGALMLFQLATDVAPKHDEFLPVSGLCISTSQALLFTAALLALYNSRLVNWENILWNTAPIVWFTMYGIFTGVPEVQRVMKIAFLSFYIIQLLGYTVMFFFERRKYLIQIAEYFDDYSPRYFIYRNNGITTLFLCSLAVGIAALASYFFRELWQLTAFIAGYTAYYIAVAIYFLGYQWQSQMIHDVTTPEEWDKTEDYMKEIR